jgi:two-component system, sensor histidine kinase and response regulator
MPFFADTACPWRKRPPPQSLPDRSLDRFPVSRPRWTKPWLMPCCLTVLLLALLLDQTRVWAEETQLPRKNLTVVLDNDYPPYIFPSPNGGYQGILVDLWKLWEQKTGVPVTLAPMEWQAAQEYLLQGKADVIDMLFRNDARERHFAFSDPYATLEVPVFVHKDLGGLHSLPALRGVTVGVKKGDASIDILSRNGILPLVAFDGYEEVVKAARDGAIKVFCVDKPPAMYYLYKYGLEKDFRLAFTLYTGQFHRAVRLGDEAHLLLVEDGFSRITPQERAAIDGKWLGEKLFSSPVSRHWSWILAAVAVVIAALLAFTSVLRRTLRRQTSRLGDLLAAMGQSEERYRELVQGVSSVIVRLTPQGGITFCNEYAQRFYGYSQSEMQGREFAGLIEPLSDPTGQDSPFPPPDFPSPADHGASLVREGMRRDGQRVLIAWSIRALRAPSGQIVEILCVGNDITERKRAEEALRASEERYALVAQGANDGIWDWDLLHNTVYFSPRYLEILGYGPGEVPQQVEEWSKRLHPEDAEAVIRENKRCADGEMDKFAIEYRMRHKDGTYRWILGRGASLRAENGRVTRMAGTHTDITRRKKDEAALRESQDRLAQIFRFTPVGIALTSRRESRIIDCNEACARMFGFAKKAMLGRSTLELGLWRRLEDRDGLMADMDRHGVVVAREMELNHKNGTPLVVLCSCVFNQAYGEPCVLSVLVDISERKAMEQALRRSKEAAEAANRAKSEFLSTMSHEIRTPMNAILGMVDVLAATGLDARQSHALRSIENAGANLLALLNNILDLSRIEAGRLIMEEKACDPVEMAAKVVDMLRPGAQRKGLELRLAAPGGLPSKVSSSPDRIHQVLVNLVGNAVKFTNQGEIVVTVDREDAPGGPQLRLSVSDTGIGIPPDKQTLIFERFTQIDATSHRQAGGVGLGLTICKRLVELMGGRIRVESRLGAGSTFIVTLPLRPAPEPAKTAPASRHSQPQTTGTVLLVEDSTTNAEVMRLMLEGAPYAVTWAPSGQAALEAFRSRPFDIVLMDVEMPGMDGNQTTQAMRQLETELGRPRTAIIALTAHAFEEHRQRSLAAGCDDFQIKPIPKAKLLDLLSSWMAVRPE